ncbi:MAG: type VI secretion system baseplate subunit TssG [Planctomycetes bacterium]|nr:type VI secretion system baseplate subunit TssG [Planctomycetota bacterium]
MAAEGVRKSAALSLVEQLSNEAYRFDFFQAIRILERLLLKKADSDRAGQWHPVGHDFDPKREVVRFRTLQSQSFPGSAIVELRRQSAGRTGGGAESGPLEMVVSFLGLTGPAGVMPLHYSRLIIDRNREKDFAPHEFYDIFNHRLISLFFRAWEKYRFPTAYERSHGGAPEAREDLFTGCLFSLAGMGTRSLRRRLGFEDETLLFYSGLFADGHRPASALERMLADYFDVPVQVEQFQGQWLHLEFPSRTRVASGDGGELNNRLGASAILGERVWDVQSKFRIRLGPLDYERFSRMFPSGTALKSLFRLARAYAGLELDFDVQALLKAAEAPPCRLGGESKPPALLGWNTWLATRPMEKDPDDVLFCLHDF